MEAGIGEGINSPAGAVYFQTAKTTEDCTAEFQAALNEAIAKGAWLILPNHEITLTGTVEYNQKGINPLSKRRWCMRGGPGTTIVDKNTTGPCLRYQVEEANELGTPYWEDFLVQLGCEKAAYNMVEWVNLHETEGFSVVRVRFWGNTSAGYKCRSAIHMEALWNGKFDTCRWQNLQGHDFWYANPGASGGNGGNVEFSACVSDDCTSGGYIDGLSLTNNVLFNNHKFAGETGRAYYSDEIPGKGGTIPAKGATTIKLNAGIEGAQFQPNAAIVIFSEAGIEVVHAQATGTPYNEGTGVLTLRDAVQKTHATDMRLIVAEWSIITAFLTTNVQFNCCHFEQRPGFLSEGWGSLTECMISCNVKSVDVKSTTGKVRSFWIASPHGNSGTYYFRNAQMNHIEGAGEQSEYRMVEGLQPAGCGAVYVWIDLVNTYGQNKAGQGIAKWQPLGPGDTYFAQYGKRFVRTASGGVELNTFSEPVRDLNVGAKTTAEINAALEAVGAKPVADMMIADKTNHLLLVYSGTKWFKTAALTEIA